MIDIVFPDNNEKEFVRIAGKLGLEGLCLVYPYTKKPETTGSRPEGKRHPDVFRGVQLDQKTANKGIAANLVVIRSGKNNRHALEKSRVDIIYDLENHMSKDFMHQLNSGLNQVLCKIASEKGRIIGLNFSTILSSGPAKRTKLLGRMMQNIRLCRKYKVRIALASFATDPYQMRSAYDLMSFGISLGMHPKEAKDAVKAVSSRIVENASMKKGTYIGKGVELVQ